jgi:hypothetical protein
LVDLKVENSDVLMVVQKGCWKVVKLAEKMVVLLVDLKDD